MIGKLTDNLPLQRQQKSIFRVAFILAEAWTSGETLAVIAAMGVLVTTIGGVVTGVIVAWKANTKAGEAQATAAQALGHADGAQMSIGRLSTRANSQDVKISTLELASTPAVPLAAPMQVVQQPPVPKPRRVRIGNDVFEGVLVKVDLDENDQPK